MLLVLGDAIAGSLAAWGGMAAWKQVLLLRIAAQYQQRAARVAAQALSNIALPIWFYLLPIAWIFLMIELYDPHVAVNRSRTLRGITAAAAAGAVAYALVFILNRDPAGLPRIGVAVFLALAAMLTLVWRLGYIAIYTRASQQRTAIIIGAGKAGKELAQVYTGMTPKPFVLVGFVDDDPRKAKVKYSGYPVLGRSSDLLALADEHRLAEVIIAITGEIEGRTFQTILDLQERGVEVTRMATVYEELTQRVPIHHLEAEWIIRSFVEQMRVNLLYNAIKRLIDIAGGLVGTLIWMFLTPFIALGTIIDTGLPVLYSQDRLGRGGAEFTVLKFRTMVQDAEADGSFSPAAENDRRVTRFGRFLRVTHLDELPQFWTVLRGDMSLVGPRAERAPLVAQFQKEIPFYRARLLVQPGLTGWAQVNYGYVVTVTETAVKLEYDLYYIEHRSLLLDAIILLRTVGAVLGGKGR